jgi:phospholipid transport system substrate-binding protein
MNKLIKIGLLMLSLVFSTTTLAVTVDATTNSPYKLLEQVGTNLFNKIALLSPEQRNQAKVMEAIVESELMPYVDYRYTAYKIMGSYVSKSTKEQRDAFVDAMYSYLVSTYANALSQYKNQQVNYEPDHQIGNSNIVAANVEITEENAPTISLSFKFRKNSHTGQWKAFDMIVEGVSLVSSKQAEISGLIRKVGLDGVIVQLREKSLKSIKSA